jgi:AraC-like DNA-binding protein
MQQAGCENWRVAGTASIALPSLYGAFRAAERESVPVHQHEVLEIVCVVEGNVTVNTLQGTLRGRPGSVFLIPPGLDHDQRSHGRWAALCLLVIPGATRDDTFRCLNLRADKRLFRWVEDVCDMWLSMRGRTDAASQALTLTILQALDGAERQEREERSLHPSLARAVAFIDECPPREIQSHELCAVAGCSYGRLSALFRERFACSPKKYIERRRLEVARRLLLDPHINVTEVARRCGYGDANYFMRVFRRYHGLPAGKWRSGSSALDAE